MNKIGPATQPSKAAVPTLQKPATTLDQKQTDLAVVGVITLPKEDIEKLLRNQVPQQSTTINVQINNTVINNYNGPPPQAQNLGHQGEFRDRSHQSIPKTAPESRAIEGKPHGVEYVPSAPSLAPKTQPRIQNGSGDRVNSIPPAKAHTPSTHGRPQVETTPVLHKRPATDQANLGTTHNGSSKLPSANSPVGQVSGQGRGVSSKPKSSETRGFFDKIIHPHQTRAKGSHPDERESPSTTTSPARRSNSSPPIASWDRPTAKQPQHQTNHQAAHPRYQISNESRGRTAAEQPVVRSQHRGSQPTKREEPVVISHGHPAANKPEDHRAGDMADIPKELKKKDIGKHLEDLNCRLGNHRSETSSGPARLILIGKASAEMMGLKTAEKVYHIDVVLDLQAIGERLVQIRQCMKQVGVFREFDRPQEDTKKAWKTFFGTSAHRAVVFNDVAGKGQCVSNKKHLKAYVMDADRAFEFELRRWGDRGSDERTKETSVRIAKAILQSNIALGCVPPSRNSCRNLKYIRTDACVPDDPIHKVL